MKIFNVYNKEGFPSWSGDSEGSIPTIVTNMVNAEFERSSGTRYGAHDPDDLEETLRDEIMELESKQQVLEKAFGRYLEVAAPKGILSATEIGYVLGFVKPEDTKFIEPRRSGPITEVDPIAWEKKNAQS